jgi:hypothetical protein
MLGDLEASLEASLKARLIADRLLVCIFLGLLKL